MAQYRYCDSILVFPPALCRNSAVPNLRRQLGWMAYDLRDIQRFGPAVEGAPQANVDDYSPWGHAAFSSIDLTAWSMAPDPVSEKTLTVNLTAAQAASTRTT